jgi:hypothetical protein
MLVLTKLNGVPDLGIFAPISNRMLLFCFGSPLLAWIKQQIAYYAELGSPEAEIL